jgi:hypothetical protein
MKRERVQVNPWTEKLGCEVTLCCEVHCDRERMKTCALREYFNERVAILKAKRDKCKGCIAKGFYSKELEGMGVHE